MSRQPLATNVDRADFRHEERLHDAARRLADVVDSGLPVHGLRPVLREETPGEPLVFEPPQAVTLQAVVRECQLRPAGPGGDTVVACTYRAACHDEETIRALVLAAPDDVRAALGAPEPADCWALPPVARSIGRGMRGA